MNTKLELVSRTLRHMANIMLKDLEPSQIDVVVAGMEDSIKLLRECQYEKRMILVKRAALDLDAKEAVI